MAEKKKSYRLSIDLTPGQDRHDIIEKFDSAADATLAAMTIIKQGYVIEDRTADSSRVNSVFYPLAQIRSLNIYEDK